MPPPPCNKCRQCASVEGDTWCLGCSAWEAIGRELSGHWDQGGTRTLANDLVINVCRQVRALRALGAGLSSSGSRPGTAGSGRATPVAASPRGAPPPPERERSELRRRYPRSPPGPPPRGPKQEAEASDEGSDLQEEEEEEEEVDPPTRGAEPKRKPPGPDSPPRGGSHRSRHRERSRSAGRRRAERQDRDTTGTQHHTKKHTRSGRTRRGGRKHQGLKRLAQDPLRRVHRKITPAFLELSSLTRGGDALSKGD